MPDAGLFGRYRLFRLLAQGGMAEVFLAKQEGPVGFQKAVVVKRVLPHLARHADLVQMFLDEARLGARLSHPNVVQIFDFGEIEGTYFLAMEYLAGEDVAALIARARALGRPTPPQIAAIIAAAACDGLDYVHSLTDDEGKPLGVVHRDVSPSNLFVTYQGAVKLLDFGIAKAQGKSQTTKAGTLKGKSSYMSPEQVEGRPLDGRSDLFALGAVLYELLTGVRLFARENEVAAARAIADEPIAPPSRQRQDLPEELDAIVMKALARPLEQRFQTALEMRTALDHFLSALSYVPAAAQLRDHLVALFGEAHVREHSRAPVTDPSARLPTAAAESVPKTFPSAKRPRAAGRGRLVWLSGSTVLAALLGLFVWHDWSSAADPGVAPSPLPHATPNPTPTPTPNPTPAAIPTPTPIPIPSIPTASPTPNRTRRGLRRAGTLAVTCLPWCRVYVDGRDTGKMSPATDIRLSGGKHVLTVVNPPSGRSQRRAIEITPGRTHVENVLF